MKKSLIALAVAGAFAAPAFAATSNVDVYGVLNIAIQDTDVSGYNMAVLDNTSRIGFKGSEDLGGGLKAIWQIESGLGGHGSTTIGTVGNATLGTRNTFVGLAGGFGTVLMGKHDTPYKLGTGSLDIFADTYGDYNLGRIGDTTPLASFNSGVQLIDNTQDARDGQALAYISPTWSGFHFAAAVVMGNGEAGSFTGATTKTIDAVSATGVYVNGPLFASLSYQTTELLDSSAWKVGVGYTFGDTKVGAVYENVDKYDGVRDRDSWLLNITHTMGPIVLKAQYGQANVDVLGASLDQDAWAIGADYNLSKRTSVYFVYGDGDTDTVAGNASGWNLGIKHSF